MNWISVKDRLPDNHFLIIAFDKNYGVHPCFYGKDGFGKFKFFYDETTILHNVTHWMPLPDAPKEEK